MGWRGHRWGDAPTFDEIPPRTPGVGEVGVTVEACGVGLTVLNCINGNLGDDPALLPRVPGHELVGRVTAAGPGVDTDLVGRRVVAYFYRYCGACSECVAGRQPRCRNLDGYIGVHSDGGYAPTTVLPARNAIPIDDSLDPVAATVVPDAVATPLHVCGPRAQVRPGDRVAVIGAGGGVGAHMLQMAALFGGVVAGLDVGDRKLAAIEELGAVAADSSDFDRLDAERLLPGGRPTVVIDLLGSRDSLAWAADALGSGGRLVVLTTFPGRTVDVATRELVFRELTVLGSRYASVAEVTTAADLVATGRISPVIGQMVEGKSVLSLHDALRAGDLVGRGALTW